VARARAGQRADDGGRGHHRRAGAGAVSGSAALLHRRHPRRQCEGLSEMAIHRVSWRALRRYACGAWCIGLALWFCPLASDAPAMERSPQLELTRLDEMDDVSAWKSLASDGVSASVHGAKGMQGG